MTKIELAMIFHFTFTFKLFAKRKPHVTFLVLQLQGDEGEINLYIFRIDIYYWCFMLLLRIFK